VGSDVINVVDDDDVKFIAGGGSNEEEEEALIDGDADSGAAGDRDADDEEVGGEGIATRTATVIRNGGCSS